MSEVKRVELERTTDSDGQQGSFGFSILGGYGTKLPACVCEVDPGGPADQTNQVEIGDRLLELNGEALERLTSRELVQRIRHAPTISTFVLSPDEALRQHIRNLLEKKQRRAAEKARRDRVASTGSEGSVVGEAPSDTGGKFGKKKSISTPSVLVGDSGGIVGSGGSGGGAGGGGDDKKKKASKLDKIIEVEPSVNISNGQSAGIVQVVHNRIVGRLEGSTSDSPSSSPRHSPAASSPRSSTGITEDLQPLPRGSPLRSRRAASDSPGRSPARPHSQEQTPPPASTHLPHPSGTSHSNTTTTNHSPNISLDSLSNHSAASSIGSPQRGGVSSSSDHAPSTSDKMLTSTPQGANGVIGPLVQVIPDSSDVNSSEETGSTPSIDEKSGQPVVLTSLEGEGEEEEAQRAGNEVNIPAWNGHVLQTRMGKQPRASLDEEILIGELKRGGRAGSEGATPSLSSEPVREVEGEEEQAQQDETSSKGTEDAGIPGEGSLGRKLKRGRSSKRKDEYAEAVFMARQLYMLDGYKRSEVAAKLADRSTFGQSVAKEYLKFFEFQGQSLDDSLRLFLSSFSLTGESQERERVMVHFSNHFHECNPQAFNSADTVHGLTIALLLLNTDLHNDHGGRKMTVSGFSDNLERINVKLRKDLIKSLYESIRKRPLEWAMDDDDRTAPTTDLAYPGSKSSPEDSQELVRVYHVTIPGTFVEVEMSENAPLFKEGYVLKKNIMEGPHRKVARGKRQWKPYYAYLKGFLLYLEPPRGGDLHLENTSSAISICHCLAMGAYDYHKKNSVLRVTTSEWTSFLLQAADTMDMQQWISAIDKAAGMYSAAPLAAPVSSSTVFQRPTYPVAPTKNTLQQQMESHEAKVKSLTKELEEHQAYKPKGTKAKHGDLKNWFDKFEFLQFEIKRFQIYQASLSNSEIDFNTPLPSGLVPSPSISTLATSGTQDGSSELTWKSMTPPHSPTTRNKLSAPGKGGGEGSGLQHAGKAGSNSPLMTSKGHRRK